MAEQTGPAASATPQVLIAPAMGIGSSYYRPLVDTFISHGWSARALPRRGFEVGGERARRGVDWSYGDEIAVITAAVEQARADAPTRPVVVLGHSLGGQLVVGNQLTGSPADAVVTVGSSIPDRRHFAYRGWHLALLAGVAVPAATAVFGHLPPPMFGAPGAATMMRQWATMVRTGRPPFAPGAPITAPSLLISLGEDRLAPGRSVDAFAADLFAPAAVQRWDYAAELVPAGQSNDHTSWVRTPRAVVEKITGWWEQADR